MTFELLFTFNQYKAVTMNNTPQISKEELLYVSEQMGSLIMGMIDFVQTNNKQCLNCEKKAISQFVMQNACCDLPLLSLCLDMELILCLFVMEVLTLIRSQFSHL